MMSFPGAADVGEFADGRIKFIGIYLDKNSRLAGVKLADIPKKLNYISYFSLMKTIGIEQVVSARLSAINTLLQHIRKGKVLSAISVKGEQAEVVEALVLETSDIVDIPLNQISFPKEAIAVGVISQDDIIIPTGDSVIQPEDRFIIFARKPAIPKVEKILSVRSSQSIFNAARP
jgi:trk system potassium uptake protein TrkA